MDKLRRPSSDGKNKLFGKLKYGFSVEEFKIESLLLKNSSALHFQGEL